jgi:hypothetical protein
MRPAVAWLVAVAVASPAPQGDGPVNPDPPTEHRPASKVEVDHKYYSLSTYQNNAGGTFDDNFISMEAAELKRGEPSWSVPAAASHGPRAVTACHRRGESSEWTAGDWWHGMAAASHDPTMYFPIDQGPALVGDSQHGPCME